MSKYINILYLCVLIHNANLMDVTYYEILGVSKQAATQEIKQAYKKLAIKYHPDKNSDEAVQEKFLKITEAYETLKDPEKRRKYDIYGSHGAYTRKYDYQSQSEYNNLFYNGLYHNDPYVVTLSSASFYGYLTDGFHFINFYSPFCPPCQHLADHWKKFAEIYQGIVKVGAVNCKYHNSFCYHNMRIGSYPTLLFYPNGKQGSYIYYTGEDTFDGLEAFVMKFIKNKIHVPVISHLRSSEKPMAYVLGSNNIEDNALTRLAFHLKGLTTVVLIEDEELRDDLTDDPETIVVFEYKKTHTEISSSDERTIIKQIVGSLPKLEEIDPNKLKDIRNKLRSGDKKPWVIYFQSEDDDQLLLHQMKLTFPYMNFGTIDCKSQQELCVSLQVESPPCWAVLKRGGAYQRAYTHPDIFIQSAAEVYNLHTLSVSELQRILDGDVGTWVLLVVPHQLSWEHIADPFTEVSKHYIDSEDINFGIMVCSLQTEHYCRDLAHDQPAILVQEGGDHHVYNGRIDTENIIDFIQLLKDSGSVSLSEEEVLGIMDVSGRQQWWLVAFLPASCDRRCRDLAHEWRIIARRLRPLDWMHVGVLQCEESRGLCANVRQPTARLYPPNKQHYILNLQQKSEAPYILEWVLEHIDDVEKLSWHTFAKQVADDINTHLYKRPWLVYFHSPRCHHCYEKYPDFALASIFMGKVVNFGKVNCLSERNLCQQEHITSYPTLKLYLRNRHHGAGYRVLHLRIRDYKSIMDEVRPYLPNQYHDANLLGGLHGFAPQMFHFKHDEL
ncbi:PREDICTED: dnaJ homolog subfamily C member 10-like [Papilio xuthus]|uniref:DnaJ homolog subfamily C member 10 n=1 Tax=Papilio xuthus TaxID=66420 RepID=A0AAJ6ZSL6_PAPXU|nr:PREDICTED: dnaJ homolog subfamily C member 10-like [Papilio xuthus]